MMTDLVLVWDLDGTMIADTGGVWTVQPRPNLEQALEYTFRHCAHVGVWTAASREWYDFAYERALGPILHRLGKQFAFVWCGDRCAMMRRPMADDGFSAAFDAPTKCKPLQKFWRRQSYVAKWGVNRHNMLIIDDTPSTYRLNWGNAVPISTFDLQQPHDGELVNLTERLERLIETYMQQNTRIFYNLGFTPTIVEIIHSLTPIRSLRHIKKL
jgi:hypothetical protein